MLKTTVTITAAGILLHGIKVESIMLLRNTRTITTDPNRAKMNPMATITVKTGWTITEYRIITVTTIPVLIGNG